jgi:hypothetical protein
MFEIGQQVLCILDRPDLAPRKTGAGPTASKDMHGLTAGNVYTIIDFYDAADNWPNSYDVGHICCVLKEIKRPHASQPGFWIGRFRPLKDTKLDLFRKMCLNNPGKNMLELCQSEIEEILTDG